ncbi:hypothetical protein CRG98_019077 [Punica granatum]|uniref:Uncharacterized protein n=1 Tax=Punica granatum TaxID=22663 RepID=A0A2I0JWD5_PUNGR|nr:hypothetical protein CRG98_019077 [Punica granatum]
MSGLTNSRGGISAEERRSLLFSLCDYPELLLVRWLERLFRGGGSLCPQHNSHVSHCYHRARCSSDRHVSDHWVSDCSGPARVERIVQILHPFDTIKVQMIKLRKIPPKKGWVACPCWHTKLLAILAPFAAVISLQCPSLPFDRFPSGDAK